MPGKRERIAMVDSLARIAERNRAACRQASVTIPIPDDVCEAYDRFVVWRHITTKQPVMGIPPLIREYFEQASCWRHTREGGILTRVAGSDAIIKSRKMYVSSGVMGASLLEMCRVPNTRTIMVVQRNKASLMYPIWRQFGQAVAALPPGWAGISRQPSSETYGFYFENGSSWELGTAGSTEAVADALVRSGTIDIAHLSECGMYDHYPYVVSAIVGAMPEGGGWLIAETTPPRSKEHPFALEYDLSTRDEGMYEKTHFFPWRRDPNRVIPRTDSRYARVMTTAFADDYVTETDAEREVAYALSREQTAWRRWHYLRGSAKTRAEKRREYPEDLITCYGWSEEETYLHRHALQMLTAMERAPVHTEELHRGWTGYVWLRDLDRALLTTDSATWRGKDSSVVLVIDPYTMDLAALVHGDATASMHHQGIHWALEQVGCRETGKHWISPEMNYDDRIGLVTDRLMKDRTITLWYRQWVDRSTGQFRTARAPGYTLGPHNRDKFIELLTRHLEGDLSDPETAGPQSALPSKILIDEAHDLRTDNKGVVRAKEGSHDDVIMALAGAIWTRAQIRLPSRRREYARQAQEHQTRTRRYAEKFRPR